MDWMCGFWHPCRNACHDGQEWGYAAGKGSLWSQQVTEDANACLEGLENLLSYGTPLHAVSNDEPRKAWHPQVDDEQLHVMLCVAQICGSWADITWPIACTCKYEV